MVIFRETILHFWCDSKQKYFVGFKIKIFCWIQSENLGGIHSENYDGDLERKLFNANAIGGIQSRWDLDRKEIGRFQGENNCLDSKEKYLVEFRVNLLGFR